MIKTILLENWKGFQKSILHIAPFMVLTGANGSGKSNALGALRFLECSALGVALADILRADEDQAWYRRQERFALEAVVSEGDNEKSDTDFVYRMEVSTRGRARVHTESLRQITWYRTDTPESDIPLFFTEAGENEPPVIRTHLPNPSWPAPWPWDRKSSILGQLYPFATAQVVNPTLREAVIRVRETLANICVIDPVPSLMRDYSWPSHSLGRDAANMANVIASLDNARKKDMAQLLTWYAQKLPATGISAISARTVGPFNADAMLCCIENWGTDSFCVDAHDMSEATLRFLTILAAIATRPDHSLLVVEDMERSLDPSSAQLLLDALRTQAKKRAIDIMISTHNPALLESIEPERTPFVTLCHRNTETGACQLTLLEDLPMLLKLLSSGSQGTLAREGKLEAAAQG